MASDDSLGYAIEMTQTVNDKTTTKSIPHDSRSCRDADERRLHTEPRPLPRSLGSRRHDTTSELEIVLSGAIDAVNALAPNYSLDRQNVGP